MKREIRCVKKHQKRLELGNKNNHSFELEIVYKVKKVTGFIIDIFSEKVSKKTIK